MQGWLQLLPRVALCVFGCAESSAAATAPLQSPAEVQAAHAAQVATVRRAADQLSSELESSWRFLSAAEKREACDYFLAEARAESAAPRALQRRLIAHALQLSDRDPSLWPTAGELTYYDPKLHAPRDPIQRKRLAPDSKPAREAAARLAAPLEGAPHVTYRYDWGVRAVWRLPGEDDPQRIFANATLGLGPDADLALALVERALDDGAQTAVQAAFGHAYTDRDGNVYPFTLYDAWSSGDDIEMPDIDTLGIVHDVLNEWKRWTAPVPNRDHKSLYEETLGPLFLGARRHRAPRMALAAVYLRGAPALAEGFDAALVRMHALWGYQAERPAELAHALSKAKTWDKYFLSWTTTVAKSKVLHQRGQERQLLLLEAEQDIRRLFQRVLKDLDLWGRTQAPAAHPVEPPQSKPGG
jgi:hypothetical protein